MVWTKATGSGTLASSSETPHSTLLKALQGLLAGRGGGTTGVKEPNQMRSPEPVRRRRVWPILVPVVLVVALAILWTGLWYYAAGAAEATIASLRAREAKVGHVFTCGKQTIGGFPFRFEVRCSGPNLDLHDVAPPLAFNFGELLTVWRAYQPMQVSNEFTGPLTVGELGAPANYLADWQLANASVHGMPNAPERLTVAVDQPAVARIDASSKTTVLAAERIELDSRLAGGSIASDPVIDIVLRLAGATAPEIHPLTTKPINGEVTAKLKGLADLLPKPMPARLRELQARGGSIEIANARLQQGDVIAAATGTLRLTERGGLDGQLDLTVVNLEQVLRALNLEQVLSQGKVGSTINALDRLMPGLGNIARQNAAPTIVSSLGAIGQRTVLDDKPAVKVPLRFTDGAVMLGPFPIGRVPPLF
jgi:hypothetical protein